MNEIKKMYVSVFVAAARFPVFIWKLEPKTPPSRVSSEGGGKKWWWVVSVDIW
jgi:hypothetical protein